MTEPNLETKTYNMYATCNQPVVRSAIKAGDSYLFFITEYRRPDGTEGLGLVGYYSLDFYVRANDDRFAVRTRKPYFLGPSHVISIGRAWTVLFDKEPPSNKRYAKRKLEGRQTERLLRLIHKGPNETSKYVSEIRRLNL